MNKMIRYVLLNLVVFAAYFLTAYFGLRLGALSGFATLVWPPTGIAIAAVVLGGYRLAPAIFVAAFFINSYTGAPLLVALGIASGNTLEAVVGRTLLHRFGKFDRSLTKAHDVFKLIALAAILSPVVSATFGVTSLFYGGIVGLGEYSQTWLAWWIGDALGALIFAPLILAWSHFDQVKLPRPSRLLEVTLLVGLLLAINSFAFGALPSFLDPRLSLTYIVFVPLIWAAIRFGLKGAASAMLVSSIISIGATASGKGPFAVGDLTESLFLLQSFMGIVSITVLILAAVSVERNQKTRELLELNDRLDREVQKRTSALEEAQSLAHLGSWEWDIPADKVTWSRELHNIFGVKRQGERSYKEYLKYIHPEDRKYVDQIVREGLQKKKSFEFFHRIVRPDKTTRTLHSRGRVVMNQKGDPINMVGTAMDVTEVKEVEAALKRRAAELEKINKTMVGRELKMLELKREVDRLRKTKNPA